MKVVRFETYHSSAWQHRHAAPKIDMSNIQTVGTAALLRKGLRPTNSDAARRHLTSHTSLLHGVVRCCPRVRMDTPALCDAPTGSGSFRDFLPPLHRVFAST